MATLKLTGLGLLIGLTLGFPARTELSSAQNSAIAYTACEDADLDDLLVIQRVAMPPIALAAQTRSPFQSRVYALSPEDHRVWVMPIGDAAIEFSVPTFAHRPLQADWVNDKLLYLELLVNPRAGVFWLIDLDSLSLVTCEHWIAVP
jgi:hypothetical protein